MGDQPILLDSITDSTAAVSGNVVICGSHGGHYPAAVASRAGVRAVVFNDAGIGLDRAGVAGVLVLADVGMAAVALDCQSCLIGSAADGAARGIVSMTNSVAQGLGVASGMTAAAAARILMSAPDPVSRLPPVAEARQTITLGPPGLQVHALDSASLVGPGDAGQIVVTGSHGALIGGNPARAIKAPVRVAVFNDAGFGLDGVGVTRLPALDGQGIAAVTVSCDSARIGDAESALETGVISCVNDHAVAQGADTLMRLGDWLVRLNH